MLLKILDKTESNVQHAVTSVVSVISSTLRGAEYLTQGNNFSVIRAVIRILKKSQSDSVT